MMAATAPRYVTRVEWNDFREREYDPAVEELRKQIRGVNAKLWWLLGLGATGTLAIIGDIIVRLAVHAP